MNETIDHLTDLLHIAKNHTLTEVMKDAVHSCWNIVMIEYESQKVEQLFRAKYDTHNIEQLFRAEHELQEIEP